MYTVDLYAKEQILPSINVSGLRGILPVVSRPVRVFSPSIIMSSGTLKYVVSVSSSFRFFFSRQVY